MTDDDPNRGAPLVVAIDLDGDRRAGRIFRSAVLTVDELRSLNPETTTRRIPKRLPSGRVEVIVETLLGVSVIDRRSEPPEPDDLVVAAIASIDLVEMLRVPTVATVRARVALLRTTDDGKPDGDATWPDWSVEQLTATTADWLVPAVRGRAATDPLRGIDLAEVLLATLPSDRRHRLATEAPTNVTIPSGRSVRVDYLDAGGPTIEAKLQEFFGAADGPRILQGRLRLRLQLLSPAGRSAAVTSDLASFWAGGYTAVRTELRGRYPRHPWPDDPTAAVPTAKLKPRPPR